MAVIASVRFRLTAGIAACAGVTTLYLSTNAAICVERLLLLLRLPEQPTSKDSQQRNHGDNDDAQPGLPPSLALGAAINVVSRKPDEPCHHLGKRQLEAVARLAQVGRQHVGGRGGYGAVRRNREAQGRREAFIFGVPRRPADDQRDHRPVGMARLEQPHLAIDIFAARRVRRSDQDQRR